jgi:hypothetical protein
MKNLPRHVYRGLRPEEIDAGCILIPKSQRSFVAHPRLPLSLPFILGERPEHAVREHQWESKFETSGISTTPHFKRAAHYANGEIIVKIDTSLLEAHEICIYPVADYVDRQFICVPEDEEIILVFKDGCVFPREIIIETIMMQEKIGHDLVTTPSF